MHKTLDIKINVRFVTLRYTKAYLAAFSGETPETANPTALGHYEDWLTAL